MQSSKAYLQLTTPLKEKEEALLRGLKGGITHKAKSILK